MEQSTNEPLWQVDPAWRAVGAGETLICRARAGQGKDSYCSRLPVASTRRANGTWAFCAHHLLGRFNLVIDKDEQGVCRVWQRRW